MPTVEHATRTQDAADKYVSLVTRRITLDQNRTGAFKDTIRKEIDVLRKETLTEILNDPDKSKLLEKIKTRALNEHKDRNHELGWSIQLHLETDSVVTDDPLARYLDLLKIGEKIFYKITSAKSLEILGNARRKTLVDILVMHDKTKRRELLTQIVTYAASSHALPFFKGDLKAAHEIVKERKSAVQ